MKMTKWMDDSDPSSGLDKSGGSPYQWEPLLIVNDTISVITNYIWAVSKYRVLIKLNVASFLFQLK